jgi:hypothetical protein
VRLTGHALLGVAGPHPHGEQQLYYWSLCNQTRGAAGGRQENHRRSLLYFHRLVIPYTAKNNEHIAVITDITGIFW